MSKTIVSRGESKTRCSAMVSSTTPRLGPRWPPVLETASTRKVRISSARAGSWSAGSALRSSGPSIESSTCTIRSSFHIASRTSLCRDPCPHEALLGSVHGASGARPLHVLSPISRPAGWQTRAMDGDRNVLGGPLEPCGTDPVTGFFRDGCCTTGPQDLGSHTVCAVVTAEFLHHQQRLGNDLVTAAARPGLPRPAPR